MVIALELTPVNSQILNKCYEVRQESYTQFHHPHPHTQCPYLQRQWQIFGQNSGRTIVDDTNPANIEQRTAGNSPESDLHARNCCGKTGNIDIYISSPLQKYTETIGSQM